MPKYILYTTPAIHKRQRLQPKKWYTTLSRCKYFDGTYLWCIALPNKRVVGDTYRRDCYFSKYAACYPPINGVTEIFITFECVFKGDTSVSENAVLHCDKLDTILGYIKRSEPKELEDRMVCIDYSLISDEEKKTNWGGRNRNMREGSLEPENYVVLDPWKYI